MHLLDTNVVSELRRGRPHGAVLDWLANVSPSLIYVSAVTIGEIQVGIELTRTQDPVRASEIESWLDGVLNNFQILPMDHRCFREWARIMHGKSRELNLDAMIAATAIVHGMTVVTRNVRDFVHFDVDIINPFDA